MARGRARWRAWGTGPGRAFLKFAGHTAPSAAPGRCLEPNPAEPPRRHVRLDHIRNFCIVAHIDHGKSTLADRLLERTATLDKRQMREQVLDDNELERERGITIKLHAVRMALPLGGRRRLRAQPDRHARARGLHLRGLPLARGVRGRAPRGGRHPGRPGADAVEPLPRARRGPRDHPGPQQDRPARAPSPSGAATRSPTSWASIRTRCCSRSAKEGIGIEAILEAIVERVPPPEGDAEAPLRALIFDSYYDKYLGAVPSVRVVDGRDPPGDADHLRQRGPPLRGHRGRLPAPGPPAPGRAHAGRGRLRGGGHQGGVRHARGRHDPRRRATGHRAAAGLPGGPAHGVRRPLPDRPPTTTRTCATRWRSSA